MIIPKEFKGRISSALVVCTAAAVSLVTIDGNTKMVWVPYVLFSVLFLISVLREVIVTVGDVSIGMSGETAIATGAVVIFYTYGAPLSLILAIGITVIYPRNIKLKKWADLLFNVSNVIIDVCAAYAVLKVLNFSIDDSILLVLLKVLAAAAAFEVANYAILAMDSAFRGEPWRELLYDLRKSLVEVLPLALFSGLLGKFYFDYGAMMLLMFAVPLIFGRELHASYAKMAETQRTTLETLTRTLEAKDKYTAGHVERVAMFAKYIGEELGYGPKHLERIRQAALLHDAGKLIVPSALLNKPGKLTDEEFKIIQRHEFVTIEILSMIDFLAPIAFLAGGDHNNMEGKSTRNLDPFIVSACDAFDAMTSSRSYRKALKMEVAFEELHSKEGKQFHPKVVEALIHAIESRGEHYGDGYEVDAVHADAPEAGLGSAGIGDLEDAGEQSDAEQAAQTAQTQAQSQPQVAGAHVIPSVVRTSVVGESEQIKQESHEEQAG